MHVGHDHSPAALTSNTTPLRIVFVALPTVELLPSVVKEEEETMFESKLKCDRILLSPRNELTCASVKTK